MGVLNQISRHQQARLRRVRSSFNIIEGLLALVESARLSAVVIGTIFLTLVEIAALCIYIYIDFQFVIKQTNWGFSIDNYPIPTPLFYVQTGFSFWFLAVWGIMMASRERSVRDKMLTFRTLTTFLTAIPQVLVFFIQFFDSKASNGYVPMFMRIWWIHYYIIYLVSMPYLTIPELVRDTTTVISPLISLMVTSAGIYSVTVRFSRGDNISAFDAFYYSFVTFGTIGFGDLSPTTDYGRAVVVCMIIAAIYIFPQLFAKLTDIISRRKLFFSVQPSKDSRHVIVVGIFTLKDVRWILQEFYTEDRLYMRTRVVFLSPVVYAPEIYLFASSPKYAESVKLIIGSPQIAADLDRCAARAADAIFLLGGGSGASPAAGSGGAPTSVGGVGISGLSNLATGSGAGGAWGGASLEDFSMVTDYDSVVTALTIHHYDPDLPIHVILKKATTRQFVARTASVVMVSEIIKINLIGLGAILPGALPLIVNLVRNYDNPAFVQHQVAEVFDPISPFPFASSSSSSSSSSESSSDADNRDASAADNNSRNSSRKNRKNVRSKPHRAADGRQQGGGGGSAGDDVDKSVFSPPPPSPSASRSSGHDRTRAMTDSTDNYVEEEHIIAEETIASSPVRKRHAADRKGEEGNASGSGSGANVSSFRMPQQNQQLEWGEGGLSIRDRVIEHNRNRRGLSGTGRRRTPVEGEASSPPLKDGAGPNGMGHISPTSPTRATVKQGGGETAEKMKEANGKREKKEKKRDKHHRHPAAADGNETHPPHIFYNDVMLSDHGSFRSGEITEQIKDSFNALLAHEGYPGENSRPPVNHANNASFDSPATRRLEKQNEKDAKRAEKKFEKEAEMKKKDARRKSNTETAYATQRYAKRVKLDKHATKNTYSSSPSYSSSKLLEASVKFAEDSLAYTTTTSSNRQPSHTERGGGGLSSPPTRPAKSASSVSNSTSSSTSSFSSPRLSLHEEAPWQVLNSWSIGNELYTIPVPIELVESDFTALYLAMAAYTVTIIGLVNAYGDVLLNPAGTLLKEEDSLICIAQDITHIADGLQALYTRILSVSAMGRGDNAEERTKGRENNNNKKKKRKKKRSRGGAHDGISSSNSGGDAENRSRRRSASAAVAVGPDARGEGQKEEGLFEHMKRRSSNALKNVFRKTYRERQHTKGQLTYDRRRQHDEKGDAERARHVLMMSESTEESEGVTTDDGDESDTIRGTTRRIDVDIGVAAHARRDGDGGPKLVMLRNALQRYNAAVSLEMLQRRPACKRYHYHHHHHHHHDEMTEPRQQEEVLPSKPFANFHPIPDAPLLGIIKTPPPPTPQGPDCNNASSPSSTAAAAADGKPFPSRSSSALEDDNGVPVKRRSDVHVRNINEPQKAKSTVIVRGSGAASTSAVDAVRSLSSNSCEQCLSNDTSRNSTQIARRAKSSIEFCRNHLKEGDGGALPSSASQAYEGLSLTIHDRFRKRQDEARRNQSALLTLRKATTGMMMNTTTAMDATMMKQSTAGGGGATPPIVITGVTPSLSPPSSRLKGLQNLYNLRQLTSGGSSALAEGSFNTPPPPPDACTDPNSPFHKDFVVTKTSKPRSNAVSGYGCSNTNASPKGLVARQRMLFSDTILSGSPLVNLLNAESSFNQTRIGGASPQQQQLLAASGSFNSTGGGFGRRLGGGGGIRTQLGGCGNTTLNNPAEQTRDLMQSTVMQLQQSTATPQQQQRSSALLFNSLYPAYNSSFFPNTPTPAAPPTSQRNRSMISRGPHYAIAESAALQKIGLGMGADVGGGSHMPTTRLHFAHLHCDNDTSATTSFALSKSPPAAASAMVAQHHPHMAPSTILGGANNDPYLAATLCLPSATSGAGGAGSGVGGSGVHGSIMMPAPPVDDDFAFSMRPCPDRYRLQQAQWQALQAQQQHHQLLAQMMPERGGGGEGEVATTALIDPSPSARSKAVSFLNASNTAANGAVKTTSATLTDAGSDFVESAGGDVVGNTNRRVELHEPIASPPVRDDVDDDDDDAHSAATRAPFGSDVADGHHTTTTATASDATGRGRNRRDTDNTNTNLKAKTAESQEALLPSVIHKNEDVFIMPAADVLREEKESEKRDTDGENADTDNGKEKDEAEEKGRAKGRLQTVSYFLTAVSRFGDAARDQASTSSDDDDDGDLNGGEKAAAARATAAPMPTEASPFASPPTALFMPHIISSGSSGGGGVGTSPSQQKTAAAVAKDGGAALSNPLAALMQPIVDSTAPNTDFRLFERETAVWAYRPQRRMRKREAMLVAIANQMQQLISEEIASQQQQQQQRRQQEQHEHSRSQNEADSSTATGSPTTKPVGGDAGLLTATETAVSNAILQPPPAGAVRPSMLSPNAHMTATALMTNGSFAANALTNGSFAAAIVGGGGGGKGGSTMLQNPSFASGVGGAVLPPNLLTSPTAVEGAVVAMGGIAGMAVMPESIMPRPAPPAANIAWTQNLFGGTSSSFRFNNTKRGAAATAHHQPPDNDASQLETSSTTAPSSKVGRVSSAAPSLSPSVSYPASEAAAAPSTPSHRPLPPLSGAASRVPSMTTASAAVRGNISATGAGSADAFSASPARSSPTTHHLGKAFPLPTSPTAKAEGKGVQRALGNDSSLTQVLSPTDLNPTTAVNRILSPTSGTTAVVMGHTTVNIVVPRKHAYSHYEQQQQHSSTNTPRVGNANQARGLASPMMSPRFLADPKSVVGGGALSSNSCNTRLKSPTVGSGGEMDWAPYASAVPPALLNAPFAASASSLNALTSPSPSTLRINANVANSGNSNNSGSGSRHAAGKNISPSDAASLARQQQFLLLQQQQQALLTGFDAEGRPIPGLDEDDDDGSSVGLTFIYLERLSDMRALSGHIVIIDLFSAFYDAVPAGDAAGSESRAIDLFTVLHPIKSRDAHTPIVLLSMMEPNEYFEELWEEHNYEPILFITGCGVNVNDLAKCNLETARSVVIFASGETSSDRSDEISLMVALSVRQAVGERNIPILTEIDSIDSLYSFPPHYSNEVCFDTATTIATGADPRARELFSFAASVLTGSVMATKMLDAAIFHNYFNPYMLKVIEALVGGSVTHYYTSKKKKTKINTEEKKDAGNKSQRRKEGRGGKEKGGRNKTASAAAEVDGIDDDDEGVYEEAVVGLSSMPNSAEDPFGETFIDVVRKFAAEGVVVLGLYRVIRDERHLDLNGRRFMLTNPPPTTRLLLDDIVYYISK